MTELKGRVEFAALQMEYSLVSRDSEKDLIPMCADMGLGTLPWSPLKFGVLTGKFSSRDIDPSLEAAPCLESIRNSARLTERNVQIADEVIRIAKERGHSPAQVALNWVDTQPGITSPAVGARTADQLADNLASLECTLPDEHMASLNDTSASPLGYPHDILREAGPNIDGEISISPEGFLVLY